ncbi:hypothetical protein [Acidithiobacillus caldus]|nr:hypothetical protein [Acidithiobacillus caldus]
MMKTVSNKIVLFAKAWTIQWLNDFIWFMVGAFGVSALLFLAQLC